MVGAGLLSYFITYKAARSLQRTYTQVDSTSQFLSPDPVPRGWDGFDSENRLKLSCENRGPAAL